MSAAKHTPGEWHTHSTEWTRNAKGPFVEVRNQAGRTYGFSPICRVRGDKRHVSEAEMHANARLIAAAPDLLEALRGLDEAYCRAGTPLTRDERNEDRKRLIAARAAIAKATGEGA